MRHLSGNEQSKAVEATLNKTDIHDGWEDTYRNPDNEAFYDLAFDLIAKEVGQPNTRFLDVGCGSCSHSFRLANRGYNVCAVDFSEPVVERAKTKVSQAGLDGTVEVRREDILAMSFDDQTFDHVMCWGVLMHIPDYMQAIYELDRVLKPGGTLVFSECNAFSLHSITMRSLKRILGKRKKTRWSPAGYETWEKTDAGELMTRQANIGWMQDELRDRGYTIRKRTAGEFSEIYKEFRSPLFQKSNHLLNRLWFQWIRLPGPALCNILIAEKGNARRSHPK